MPRIEGLEDRVVLSAITWNTTVAPNGGDWEVASNWNGNKVPTSSDTATIKLTSVGTVFLNSGNADSVAGLTTDSSIASTTLLVGSGSLTLGLSGSTFGGPVTVGSGATLIVAANVPVTIGSVGPLTDNGTLSFAAGDVVTFSPFPSSSQITVGTGGTLSAVNTQFTSNQSNRTTAINVNSGGRLKATNSTFSLSQLNFDNASLMSAGDLTGNTFNQTISVPYNDVPFLDGNTSFNAISLNAGSLNSGTLDLHLIGASANQSFVFPGNFTIGPGATLSVAANVPVTIGSVGPLTDNGTLSFAAGDVVTFSPFPSSSQITVGTGGTLSAVNTQFTSNQSNRTTAINVNSGGRLKATNSTFTLSSVTVNSGSNATLTYDSLATVLTINSGATISISQNDFSRIGANGVVAVGDPNAHIPLTLNYWGTTVPTEISAKILDHADAPVATRPTIDFSPFVSNAAGTSAASKTATFSQSDQTVTLTATVSSSTNGGVAVNEGTETFTILNGSTPVGSTTAPVNVSNGAISANYTLPGGTHAGMYTIQAVYSDPSGNFLGAIDTSQFLTVGSATTTTNAVPPASVTFSATVDQSIPLSATVTSGGGTPSEGVVTFKLLNGGTPIGSPVMGNVVGGTANATYTLPVNTQGNTYTVQAVYSDPGNPGNFATSTGTSTLTVSPAGTTTTTSVATATFNAAAGQAIPLTASVTSTAGTVNGGTVTFTVLNGATPVGSPISLNVAGGTASGSYVLPAGTAAGTDTIKAVYTGTGNFSTSTGTSTLTVGKATPTITWLNPADIGSGTALSSTQLNATASVPGIFAYNPAAGTILGIGGNQVLTANFTPTDTVDYTNTSATVHINVSPRTLQSITVTPTNPRLARGRTEQFTATGIYSDSSTADLTSQVTWASATPTKASISNSAGANGVATALTTGTTVITATMGGVTSLGDTLTVSALASTTATSDYDGDGKTDLAVYIAGSSIFAYQPSSGGPAVVQAFGPAGVGAIPLVGDFDGDGKTDLAVYIPGPSIFAYRPSSGGPDVVRAFGPAGISVPAVGDFDGSGKTELGVYIPGSSIFVYQPSSGAPAVVQAFGPAGVGAMPVVGDYDGDGKSDLAVYLPGPSIFAYRPSSGGPDVVRAFGPAGISTPVVGDYDGDGKTDLGVYISGSSIFAYQPSSGGPAVIQAFGPAGVGAIPLFGDYDGDGKTDLAVFLPSPSIFAYQPSSGGLAVVQAFGPAAISRPARVLASTSQGPTLPEAHSVVSGTSTTIALVSTTSRRVSKAPNQSLAVDHVLARWNGLSLE